MTFLKNTFGVTPVDLDEIDGLIPEHITIQSELNEWEQANIVDAQLWLNNKRLLSKEILNQNFIKKLHQKMFGRTWRWAGKFRTTDKNIGCDWRVIPVHLKQLFDDVNFQLSHNTYTIDEITIRFHHRLVSIHPFVNGNGRLSRLVTDLLLISCNGKIFSWGMGGLNDEESVRKHYICALKAADRHDYSLLLDFVRT
jgi:Fic-DOC domain mobile mystery protein B